MKGGNPAEIVGKSAGDVGSGQINGKNRKVSGIAGDASPRTGGVSLVGNPILQSSIGIVEMGVLDTNQNIVVDVGEETHSEEVEEGESEKQKDRGWWKVQKWHL